MINRNPLQLFPILKRASQQRGAAFALILFVALIAFEIFNYSTTDYALSDLLGNLKFMGIRWATLLSLAFCGIDFAGIARLFTPEQGRDEPVEVWYLFGAWVLAAAMNATLTWWGVSLALLTHTPASTSILGQATLTKIVPVFVAIMVWVIRILLIGTFSLAGDRLFTMDEPRPNTRATLPTYRPAQPLRANSPRPQPFVPSGANPSRPEPTYHPVGLSTKPKDSHPNTRY
ncbi:MAG: hypothetical protein DDG60_03320 [Anaerolineae bacterium]|nr:MAG: hypothetical protein DDG60_03320 [Anaerolineae bacterium]